MSLFANDTFKPTTVGQEYCKCFESIRGGVHITASGSSGTISLYTKINGVSIPLVEDQALACIPPTIIDEVVGAGVEFCVVIRDVVVGECVRVQVVDVNGTIGSGDGGGGGGSVTIDCVTTVTDLVDPEGVPGSVIDGGSFVTLLRQKTADNLFYHSFAKLMDDGTYEVLYESVGDASPVPNELNAIATDPNALIVWGIFQDGTTNHELFKYDIATDTVTNEGALTGIPALAFKSGGFDPITNQYVITTGGPSGTAYIVDTDTLTVTQIAGKVMAGGAGNRDLAFGSDGVAYWTSDNEVYRDADFFNPASTGTLWSTVTDPTPTQSGGSLGYKDGNVIFIGSDKSIWNIPEGTATPADTGDTVTDAAATPLNVEVPSDLAEGIDTVILPGSVNYTKKTTVCCDGITVCYLDAEGNSVIPSPEVLARLVIAGFNTPIYDVLNDEVKVYDAGIYNTLSIATVGGASTIDIDGAGVKPLIDQSHLSWDVDQTTDKTITLAVAATDTVVVVGVR